MNDLKVPIKDEDGTVHLEDWNPLGPQSDGSTWTMPVPLIPKDHEHYFRLTPGSREATCSCGFGGRVYPHNARIKNGHIYDLDNNKII